MLLTIGKGEFLRVSCMDVIFLKSSLNRSIQIVHSVFTVQPEMSMTVLLIYTGILDIESHNTPSVHTFI